MIVKPQRVVWVLEGSYGEDKHSGEIVLLAEPIKTFAMAVWVQER